MSLSRFRLTLAYALFSTLLLAGGGLVLRSLLAGNLEQKSRDTTEQQWLAVKGFLRIRNGGAAWFYNREDPDEATIVSRLQRVYLLADDAGKPLQVSDLYRSLGSDTPEEVRAVVRSQNAAWKVRSNYLLRSGVIYSNDERRIAYFVAIGNSLTDNQRIVRQLTEVYIGLMAIMVAGGCLLCRFVPNLDQSVAI